MELTHALVALVAVIAIASTWFFWAARRAANAAAREALQKKQFYDSVYDPRNRTPPLSK
jgi:uncharacterized membrane protein YdjX (TVP38/TMEM64 family)